MFSIINKFLSSKHISKFVFVNTHKTLTSISGSDEEKMTKSNGVQCTDIVWMDLEMTGLNVREDKILEISCLITDKDLNIKSEGVCFAIQHPKEVLDNMNEWCVRQHNASGLVQKCLESQITPAMAESMILNYLKENLPKGKCPLAGNSVYMDRAFLREHMPTVDDYMHYRIIDVSTVKELCQRWNPQIVHCAPKKRFAHRSLEDIRDSIEELQYYRTHFFKECQ